MDGVGLGFGRDPEKTPIATKYCPSSLAVKKFHSHMSWFLIKATIATMRCSLRNSSDRLVRFSTAIQCRVVRNGPTNKAHRELSRRREEESRHVQVDQVGLGLARCHESSAIVTKVMPELAQCPENSLAHVWVPHRSSDNDYAQPAHCGTQAIDWFVSQRQFNAVSWKQWNHEPVSGAKSNIWPWNLLRM